MKLGMAMVMEDRAAYGFVGVRSIRDNVVLPNSNLYIKNGFIQKKKVADDVNKLIERLSIKAPGMETWWEPSAAETSRRWCSENGW